MSAESIRRPRELPTIAFFRNDDVNELTEELIDVTKCLVERDIPIVHAIEPGNVTDECVVWLKDQMATHGRLVQIMQHGYNHTKHGSGEFGGGRPYEEQYEDLRRGKQLMDEKFGDTWFSSVNYPYGPYDQATIRATDALGFRVFNGHFNPRLSRRVFYRVGRALGKGQILGKHVSHHLQTYPGTSLFTIDMAISYISRYYGDYGSRSCDWCELDFMMRRFDEACRYINVVGWLLHHRYHTTPESLKLVADTVDEMRRRKPDIEFWNFAEIEDTFASRAAAEAV